MSGCVQQLSLAATFALASLAAVAVRADSPVNLEPEVEFPAETAALVAATVALFDAVEAGDGPDERAPVIRLPALATKVSLDTLDKKAGVLAQHGPVRHLTGYRITWYPVERFLGSVDFMGTWDRNRNIVCGYVTWDLSDPEAPVLDQISANYVDLAELSQKPATEIHEALLDANCAYGAIDANFTVFDPAG